MTVSRLRDIPGIGVDVLGDRADALADPDLLRMENLDTDLRPPHAALVATHQAVDLDAANSYLPFQGSVQLRRAASWHVGRLAGRGYDPETECVTVAGGLNGVFNTLLATVEPGDEVVLPDPIYAGLVNRVRLAGGVPRFVACRPTADGWWLDPAELAAAVGPRTAAVLLMSPAMPSGLLLDERHWAALAEPCHRHDAWLVYDAAMERIRFDDRPPHHPAAHDGLAPRTITVGSASKELRMIGWRVGWVVGPAEILADIRLVGLSNVVSPVGLAERAVAEALTAPGADEDLAVVTAQWRLRAETVLAELAGYPLVRPGGGWSLLLDARQLGLDPGDLSERLLTRGKVAATPMTGWGPSGERYLRLVFANEPPHRLAELGDRFRAALA
ncbi:pyridoxal phosphate-dependent aminotransferase [Streptomyces sp. DSM 44915]|uniref:Pyridoxal phosphate-dependent aminotransferase n=1 Tax=Streptomyces chisholmiae TaxID=3075540 RepID=A0ABU2JVH7_9ACTN|nr:pyridoxal phosphate-dependent aminotransferase [Streptomyces sp. DSM 44915]MDT0268238.1 pyridoxal phosphate-dependent aminotransferase [Streptomyces sp. DSM 44915]